MKSPLLVDTNLVFEAHRCGCWGILCERYDVLVPSVVADREAFFYDEPDGTRRYIDLRGDAARPQLAIVEASFSEIATLAASLHPALRNRLDAGEMEALAVFARQEHLSTLFATADGAAIEAAICIQLRGDRNDTVTCLESLLSSIGITKALSAEHRREFLARKRGEAGIHYVQGLIFTT